MCEMRTKSDHGCMEVVRKKERKKMNSGKL